MHFVYPTINLIKTGENIKKLRIKSNMSVKDLQMHLGFDSPQAIYKWQWGQCLPSIDNLVALAKLFNVTIDQILVVSDK
ncbi:MAG TPA: helix-turn-helix transcriptional regulator [Acholeplasmataceae bacterium]|jgi:transcriptional regulator with XRE-family HTH domain|nr:helix-turn-helix transcriptional regulator [Acholeplasmataceae bacterium]